MRVLCWVDGDYSDMDAPFEDIIAKAENSPIFIFLRDNTKATYSAEPYYWSGMKNGIPQQCSWRIYAELDAHDEIVFRLGWM